MSLNWRPQRSEAAKLPEVVALGGQMRVPVLPKARPLPPQRGLRLLEQLVQLVHCQTSERLVRFWGLSRFAWPRCLALSERGCRWMLETSASGAACRELLGSSRH